MTTVETIGRIRRAYFVQRQSVREIARRLHVSRKTVRKAIEAEDGKFSYDRTVQPMPKLGAHVAELERLLAENERKPRRELVNRHPPLPSGLGVRDRIRECESQLLRGCRARLRHVIAGDRDRIPARQFRGAVFD